MEHNFFRIISLKNMKWLTKTAWLTFRTWKRSKNDELRELDMFRKCVRLERKAAKHPHAVPLLMELMDAYRATGQKERRIDIMRRLRDIEPRPVPEFMWDEQPSGKVVQNNIAAWCCKIEKLIAEQKMESIHFQHIQGFLRISHDNAVLVCNALVGDGVLGSYDMATGRYPVLKMT
jgi:hypothetical protein